jgi:hypothetical protein
LVLADSLLVQVLSDLFVSLVDRPGVVPRRHTGVGVTAATSSDQDAVRVG